MKKTRNAFFSEAQMSTQSYYPQPQPMMMNQMAGPYQASQSSQSFYAGPGVPANYNNNTNYGYDYSSTNDIDSRLSKIERQLNRIDARLNKLESSTYYTTDNIESSNSSLYMV